MVTPDAKREAVADACQMHGLSQRRACNVLGVDRTSVLYRSIRPDDQFLRDAMKAVAAERRRFGYRRIHVMLQRQGIEMNLKKLRRLYREEKLQVRKRGGTSPLEGAVFLKSLRKPPSLNGIFFGLNYFSLINI